MHFHYTMRKNWTSKLKLSNTQCQQHWRHDTIWVQQQNGCECEITSLLVQQLCWQSVNQLQGKSAQLTVTGCNWTTTINSEQHCAGLAGLPLCHNEAKMKKIIESRSSFLFNFVSYHGFYFSRESSQTGLNNQLHCAHFKMPLNRSNCTERNTVMHGVSSELSMFSSTVS